MNECQDKVKVFSCGLFYEREGVYMGDNYAGIKSLEVAFSVLEAMREAREPLAMTEIAKRVKMSKSRLYKYLYSFEKLKVIRQDPYNLKYSLGTKLSEMGFAVLNRMDVVDVAGPILDNLRKKINHSVGMCIWTEDGPMVVRYYKSERMVNIEVSLGLKGTFSTASSKCFLANLPEKEKDDFIQRKRSEYPKDLAELEKEIAQVRRDGYAVRDEDFLGIPGNKVLAVPVMDRKKDILATVFVFFFERDQDVEFEKYIQKLMPEVKQAADSISHIVSSY